MHSIRIRGFLAISFEFYIIPNTPSQKRITTSQADYEPDSVAVTIIAETLRSLFSIKVPIRLDSLIDHGFIL